MLVWTARCCSPPRVGTRTPPIAGLLVPVVVAIPRSLHYWFVAGRPEEGLVSFVSVVLDSLEHCGIHGPNLLNPAWNGVVAHDDVVLACRNPAEV